MTEPLDKTPDSDAQIRERVLDNAKKYVLKDRNTSYGRPEDNFARIARRWNVFVKNKYDIELNLQPVDIAMMMADMKLARLENSPTHEDSWTDLAGYAACGAGIALTSKTPRTW